MQRIFLCNGILLLENTVFISYDIRAQERNDTKGEKKFLLAYRWLLLLLIAPHLHAYAIRERKCSTFLPSVSLPSRATKRAYSYKIVTNVCECKKKSVQYMLKTWSNHVQTFPERNLYFKVNYCLEKFLLTSVVLWLLYSEPITNLFSSWYML